MANIKIKDATLISTVADTNAMPVSDGGGDALKITVGQIKEHVANGLGFETFDATQTYTAGKTCYYNGAIYRFTSNKSAGAWDSTIVESVDLADLNEDTKAKVAALETQNGNSVLTTTAQTLSGAVNELDSDNTSATGRLTALETQNGNTSLPTTAQTLSGAIAELDGDVSDLSEEVDNKASADGYYAQMSVGLAENLISPDGVTTTTPYVLRPTGETSDVGSGNAQINKVKGNSIVWNQLINNDLFAGDSITINGLTITKNNKYSYTLNGTTTGEVTSGINGLSFFISPPLSITNHKVLVFGQKVSNGAYIFDNGNGALSFGNTDNYIGTVVHNGMVLGITILPNKTFNNVTIYPQFYDLTNMFGSDSNAAAALGVADLTSANHATAIANFKKLFPKNYYNTNAGTILNNKVNKVRSVGFNLYNNGTATVIGGEACIINDATGITITDADGNTITPDDDGVFTPTKSGELTITGGTSTTCICLKHSLTGKSDVVYEDYWKVDRGLINGDTRIRVKGTTNAWETASKIFNSGTAESPVYSGIRSAGSVSDEVGAIVNGKFTEITKKVDVRAHQEGDESDSSVITDGTNTNYALTTPVVYEIHPDDQPTATYREDDWGTEMAMVGDDPAYAVSSNVPITAPLGNETFYASNLKDKLRTIGQSSNDKYCVSNESLSGLITALNSALTSIGTISKSWDDTNKKWTFTFTANA